MVEAAALEVIRAQVPPRLLVPAASRLPAFLPRGWPATAGQGQSAAQPGSPGVRQRLSLGSKHHFAADFTQAHRACRFFNPDPLQLEDAAVAAREAATLDLLRELELEEAAKKVGSMSAAQGEETLLVLGKHAGCVGSLEGCLNDGMLDDSSLICVSRVQAAEGKKGKKKKKKGGKGAADEEDAEEEPAAAAVQAAAAKSSGNGNGSRGGGSGSSGSADGRGGPAGRKDGGGGDGGSTGIASLAAGAQQLLSLDSRLLEQMDPDLRCCALQQSWLASCSCSCLPERSRPATLRDLNHVPLPAAFTPLAWRPHCMGFQLTTSPGAAT